MRKKFVHLSKTELIARLEDAEAIIRSERDDLALFQDLGAQNEHLIETQQQLEASRDQYAELYDFAPVACLMLDEHGLVTEINLTGAELLGTNRRSIVGAPLHVFLVKADRRTMLDHMVHCRRANHPVSTLLR